MTGCLSDCSQRHLSRLLCSVEEYVGEIPADKREGVVQQLNEEVKRLIEVAQMHTSLSFLK